MILPARKARGLLAEFAGDWKSEDFDFNCGTIYGDPLSQPHAAHPARISRLRSARFQSSSSVVGDDADVDAAADDAEVDAAADDTEVDAAAAAAADGAAGDGAADGASAGDARIPANARLRGLWGPQRSKQLDRELSAYSTDLPVSGVP